MAKSSVLVGKMLSVMMSLLQLGCASDGAGMMAGPDCRCHRESVTSVFPWVRRVSGTCERVARVAMRPCLELASPRREPDRDRAPVVKAGLWVNFGLGFYGLHRTQSTVLKITGPMRLILQLVRAPVAMCPGLRSKPSNGWTASGPESWESIWKTGSLPTCLDSRGLRRAFLRTARADEPLLEL